MAGAEVTRERAWKTELLPLAAATGVGCIILFFTQHLISLDAAWESVMESKPWIRASMASPPWVRAVSWTLFLASRGVTLRWLSQHRTLDGILVAASFVYLSLTSLPVLEAPHSPQQLVSRLTAILSATFHGAPLVGFSAMLLCMVLFLVARRDGLLLFGRTPIPNDVPSRPHLVCATLLGALVLVLSSTAVLGYATGSPLPLPE